MSSRPLAVRKRRNHDKSLLEIADKFKPTSIDRIYGTCGNIKQDVEGNFDTKDWDKCFAAAVAAPYLLARLCAMFAGLQIQSNGQEEYKVTWKVVLEHVETGHVVTFYDWKGGSSFGSDVSGENAPKPFISDVKKLIQSLRNDRFPHPYDGCVIGEIA